MRKSTSFAATLDMIRLRPAEPEPNAEGWRGHVSGGVHAPSFNEPNATIEAGAHSLWDHASAWVPEPEPEQPPVAPPPPPPPAPRPPPSIDVGAIAKELNLACLSTMDELNRLRRRFCWLNHPDRYPDIPAEIANRRVAIANMLIDRAIENLAKPPRAR